MKDLIKREKLMVILRNLPEEKAEGAIDALYRAGIRIIEVTFNPSLPDTVETTCRTLRTIKSRYHGEIRVCAGTVVKAEYVLAAKEAGAEMIVSPHTDPEIIRLTKENGLLSVPGAFTPTEIVRAYQLGADFVKIFPIEPHNLSYLKNILAPLSHIPFIPTGGVNSETAPIFMKMGAQALVAGATVLTPSALEKNDYAEIEQNAKQLLAAAKAPL